MYGTFCNSVLFFNLIQIYLQFNCKKLNGEQKVKLVSKRAAKVALLDFILWAKTLLFVSFAAQVNANRHRSTSNHPPPFLHTSSRALKC
jgi:hypothetical protein